ncbi:MAG: protein-disulfide reductase DsbD N-terminal domain-containing protein [Armatimonadota bacterium]|nr:protein-disulfide reductase DsbD N-terminal domain-containing protein [Armatimonadota bacterium]
MRTAIIPILALFALASAQGPVSASGKLVLAQPAVEDGAAAKATIVLDVPAGHHAYAPVKANEEFIAVSVIGVKGASYNVKAYYPKGVTRKYPGMDHAIEAYEGKTSIPIKFFIPKGATAGKLTLKAVVTSQVCSNETGVCYAPSKQMVTGTIIVK